MVLGRHKINPLDNSKERDYIAVSWVWKPEPEKELAAVGGYWIESRGAGQEAQSDMRDIVLERVIKYANRLGYRLFWIDKVCIDQQDKEEVKAATQAMDLVYSLSQKSHAIINRRIGTEGQLNLFAELMKGELVNKDRDLSMLDRARKVLKLLDWLTSAGWWQRAWTFQEDYKASVNMVLLISHDPSLERLKSFQRILGSVPGADGDDNIRKPMPPTILADIGLRGISEPWDRLAIVANCCNYDARLNANELSDRGFSLSLAMLTQHLLNREVINNGTRQRDNHSATQNIFDFLKSCRLPKVELVKEGVQTPGHLWKLGKRIKAKCQIKLPREDSTPGGLEGCQRYRLKQLAYELKTGTYGSCYETLADKFLLYLDEEKKSKRSFAEEYMCWMASEVFHAMMDSRQALRLGRLVDGSSNKNMPYGEIFVCDADEDEQRPGIGSWG
ncbi:heterokaryon incompatibility protein-domain-containing protein [Rhexocercosporidium sp. MPI-PUGE-AT-0058]|nr:heterokaryon incompatibility protein-domain-containing protein [Rhexocercosporidium sp. MPI-PUGE-AT-0058]